MITANPSSGNSLNVKSTKCCCVIWIWYREKQIKYLYKTRDFPNTTKLLNSWTFLVFIKLISFIKHNLPVCLHVRPPVCSDRIFSNFLRRLIKRKKNFITCQISTRKKSRNQERSREEETEEEARSRRRRWKMLTRCQTMLAHAIIVPSK